jgi:TRAP-type transport system small permease protein
MFSKVEGAVIKTECGLCLLGLAIMVGAVAIQVLSRYMFKAPVSWAEELARACLTWLTFVGGSMALRLKAHFVIELLVNQLPKTMHNAFEMLLLVVTTALVAVMFYTGLIMLPIVHDQTSSAMGYPMSFVYLSIPVGSAFMLFHLCRFIYLRATGQYEESHSETDAA